MPAVEAEPGGPVREQLRAIAQVAGEGGLGADGLSLMLGLHRKVVEAAKAAGLEPIRIR